jgi:hypothetical protein
VANRQTEQGVSHMSTTFQTASPKCQKLDPLKRVNYTYGLVLGVDEFLQSDTYFLAKHHLENRLLHGYGTVCGLDVIAQTSPDLEVQVTPGWAINPKGQEIHVPQVMCVRVNDWLQANLEALQAAFPGPVPSTLNLCVVLCYRDCKTDVVPIPGEPCQTQSSSTAPSRIADSFELMLCLDRMESPPWSYPPPGSPPCGPQATGGLCEFRPLQLEDDAIRALAWLLCQLQASTTGPFLTLGQLEQLVLDLGTPGSPPFLGSPPVGPPYAVHASDLPHFRRAALRTWITKVRPFIASGQGAGPCCPPPERCVLLAEAALSLNSNWAATAVTIDDSRRPFLAPTDLLQEIFFEEPEAAPAPVAPAYQVVAAGYFTVSPNLGVKTIGPTFNNLSVEPSLPSSPPTAFSKFTLSFTGYSPQRNYIVKGIVQQQELTGTRATFELITLSSEGIEVSILFTSGEPLGADWGFMVEISEIGGAP